MEEQAWMSFVLISPYPGNVEKQADPREMKFLPNLGLGWEKLIFFVQKGNMKKQKKSVLKSSDRVIFFLCFLLMRADIFWPTWPTYVGLGFFGYEITTKRL